MNRETNLRLHCVHWLDGKYLRMKDMQTCFECGHDSLREAVVEVMGERNSEQFLVRTDGYKCANCNFQTIDSEQSEHFTRKLSDAYRAAHGLLTSK